MFQPMKMRFCECCKGWSPASDEVCVHCGRTSKACAEYKKQNLLPRRLLRWLGGKRAPKTPPANEVGGLHDNAG